MKANIPIWWKNTSTDIYNPSLPSFGNSFAQKAIYIDKGCPNLGDFEMIDWIYTKHAYVDLRMAALKC